ncbi:MAG TPA: RsmD family RNA methyltransferase [Acidimicrobiales bacterium]|nr:RsmD family RNA methyltransferase [Acidimicrobiales bacterium]
MRVVAGSAKGRRLNAPDGLGVRPTGDRVREAVFDMLASLDVVQYRRIADLFAGTGAMGIEALSQGAAAAFFVEREPAALDVIRTNLVVTGLYSRATVVPGDVLDWLATAPPVDVALIDPPYAFEEWPAVLERVQAGTLVLESDHELDLGPRWEALKSRRYGGTVVTLAQPAAAPPADEKGSE